MASKIALNQSQMFNVGDLIRQHCKKDADGFAVYDDGWSDEKVAAMCSSKFPCTETNVKTIRKNIVGGFRAPASPAAETAARLESLEARMAEIERWAAARTRQPFGPEWRNWTDKKK